MHYHILLTERCNSECKYCYGKSLEEFDNELDKKFKFDFSSPESSEVDIEKLKDFLARDKDAVLIFYGGEPLLEMEKIKKILDNINIPFRMQTNGKLLDKLPMKYLKKIGKLLVSIDGDKEITDFNKGKGTYNLVINNIRKILKQGYKGEIIARMVVSPGASFDFFEQVKHLVSVGFTSVHWQIDAGFYKFDYNKKKFSKFVEEYNKSIEKLVEYWINDMRKNKRVLKLYPFLGLVESLIKGEKTLLRCGAGHSGYAISTDGRVIACPIMNCIVDFEAGNLDSDNRKLKKFSVSGECVSCSYLDLCGGRCLYSNKAELWPKEGNKLICKTVKFLIDKLKAKLPEIEALIKNRTIKKEDFEYEKYFGPEIIP